MLFYFAAAIALFSTLMVITRHNAVHALLYMIISLLSVALIFFILGAPFVAALEVIIYAGAIMVLFVFVMMLLNLGEKTTAQERMWLLPRNWYGPTVLAVTLLLELVIALTQGIGNPIASTALSPKMVSVGLFGPYLLGVELASLLLLSGIVGAYHLGRQPIRGG